MFESVYWRRVWDGHPTAYDLQCRAAGPTLLIGRRGRQIVGPGRELVLVGPREDRLMAFRFRWHGRQYQRIECVAWYNASGEDAYELIDDGMDFAVVVFRSAFFEMTVHPSAPAACETLLAFLKAGWVRGEDNQYGQFTLTNTHGAP